MRQCQREKNRVIRASLIPFGFNSLLGLIKFPLQRNSSGGIQRDSWIINLFSITGSLFTLSQFADALFTLLHTDSVSTEGESSAITFSSFIFSFFLLEIFDKRFLVSLFDAIHITSRQFSALLTTRTTMTQQNNYSPTVFIAQFAF